MADEFDFRACQFYNFRSNTSCEDLSDAYFDSPHQDSLHHESDAKADVSSPMEVYSTPMSHVPCKSQRAVGGFPKRRSISMVNLNEQPKNIQAKHISGGSSDNLRCPKKVVSMSKERLEQLAKPKQVEDRFISVATRIRNFHLSTPDRFRSKLTTGIEVKGKSSAIPATGQRSNRNTIAKSPNFTKIRPRPVVALSREQREELEMEEAKKFQIKARPVNRRIFEAPVTTIQRRPNTVQIPFKFPEQKIKPATNFTSHKNTVPIFQFHARPAPNSTMRQQTNMSHFMRLNTTNVKPFSFDQRDKETLKKKEEFIKSVLEEERRAREFHANPIPKAIAKEIKEKHGSSNSSSFTSSHSDNHATNFTPFKAKPAIVLQHPPFQPKLGILPLTEVHDVQLHTDQRAKIREEFDLKIRQKEEERKLLIEENRRKLEEIERLQEAEERKLREFKANPVRNYAKLNERPVIPLTVAKSPNFHMRLNDKENHP